MAANLAVAIAQEGRSAIVIDADLRRPTLHRFFGMPNRVGFTSLIMDESLTLADVLQETDVPGLRVITSGPLPPNPLDMLASERANRLFREVKSMCDTLVIDSPPVLSVTDAMLLAVHVDSALLVASARGTRRDQIVKAYETLKRSGVDIIGAVINKVRQSDLGSYYSHYYYGYYYGTPGEVPEEIPVVGRMQEPGATTAGKHDRQTNPGTDFVHCPYLGKVEDRQSTYDQATRRHRCFRWEQVVPIRRQDQEQYCLSPLHVSCPRLTDAGALPVPEGRRRRHRRTLRILGIPLQRVAGYILPMTLLFGIAVFASILLVRRLTAAPLPTALVALGGPNATATPTATATLFPTWTPTSLPIVAQSDTPSPTPTWTASPTPLLPTPTPFLTPPGLEATPIGGAFASNLATPTPYPTSFPTATREPTSATFTSPIATPTPAGSGTSAAAATDTPIPGAFDFIVRGAPVKTLLPSGVDVCAKVFGRVYDNKGNIITNTVGVAVDWWPDNRLEVGTPDHPPINPDGTYEFCLTRGQFNLSITAPKRTSQVLWIDLDEPEVRRAGRARSQLAAGEVKRWQVETRATARTLDCPRTTTPSSSMQRPSTGATGRRRRCRSTRMTKRSSACRSTMSTARATWTRRRR